MVNNGEQIDPLFLQLVLSLQSAAMYQMGKIASPISGKVERDMEQAKISIDLLTMLQHKTKGNLKDEEQRILDGMVYNLQMNYDDELNRKDEEKTAPEDKPDPGGESKPAGEEESENSDNNL